jgi:C4-dicarboxylate-specific signal transduction histidine kinase
MEGDENSIKHKAVVRELRKHKRDFRNPRMLPFLISTQAELKNSLATQQETHNSKAHNTQLHKLRSSISI